MRSARQADQQEEIEPRGHEHEVGNAFHQHEGAGDGQHAFAIVERGQQRDHEDQHPHRTGVQAVEQAHGERERRQTHVVQRDRPAQQRHLEGLRAVRGGGFFTAAGRAVQRGAGFTFGGCRRQLDTQALQRLPDELVGGGLLGIAEDELPTNEEGRYAGVVAALLAGDVLQALQGGRLVQHVAHGDGDVRPLLRQALQKDLGLGAVRATFAHEDFHALLGRCGG